MNTVITIQKISEIAAFLLLSLSSCYQRTESVEELIQHGPNQLSTKLSIGNRKTLEKKEYFIDFDQDGLLDTIEVINTLYGPGVKQKRPFTEVNAADTLPHYFS